MTRAPRWMLDLIAVHQETTQAAGYSVPSLSGVSLLQIPLRLAFCQKKHECMCIRSMWARTAQRIRTRHGHERVMNELARDPQSGNHAARRHCSTIRRRGGKAWHPVCESVPLVLAPLWDPLTTDSRRRGTSMEGKGITMY